MKFRKRLSFSSAVILVIAFSFVSGLSYASAQEGSNLTQHHGYLLNINSN